jgi:CheY-like chemotaxis protein
MSTASNSLPLRVLVVDDLEDARESIALLVRAWGHDAQTASDGLTAIQAAPGYRPNVVLLDIGMPGMSGWDVVRALKGSSGLERTLFVAISGYGRDRDLRRSRDEGFDLHLVKPVKPDELRQLLGLEERWMEPGGAEHPRLRKGTSSSQPGL